MLFKTRRGPHSRLDAEGRRTRTRGQALVEFALILPLLALLVIMAIDFGRVFFGWVELQNMSRVGANYASLDAEAWKTPGDAAKQANYQAQMTQEADVVNCTLPSPLPPPVFTNLEGTADPHEVGDHVTVTLSCQFSLITPLASLFLGGGVDVGAESIFAIRSGTIAGAPVGPLVTPNPVTPTPAPQCTVPNFVGTDVDDAADTWDDAGFTTTLSKSPNNNSWNYIGSQSVAAGTAGPCATTVITVVQGTPPATPTPTPSPTPTAMPTPTPIAQCAVPSFSGDQKNTNALRDKWRNAGFTRNNLSISGGNWTVVGSQTLVAGSNQPCVTTTMTVGP